MDSVITYINAAACAALALVATWGCFSSKVRDGIVIKLGLVCMALGFAGYALLLFDSVYRFDGVALNRAQMLINAGFVTGLVGRILRGRRPWAPERRASDYVELDGQPHAHHAHHPATYPHE